MLKYQSTLETNLQKTTPEFHVSFNDQVDNDFNTLFKTLPPNRPYFAVGVPGSFHCQLLPEASLHIAHSSYALHWLSKVLGNEKEVTKAYFAQFKADMDAFLKARAQELVEGGSVLFDIHGVIVITEEKLDSFNLALYLPSIEEVKMVVEMNKCFTIEKICTLSHPSNYDSRPLDIERTCADIRAINENLMQDHFGSENMDQLFHLWEQNLQKNRLLYDKVVRQDVYHFALLKCKGKGKYLAQSHKSICGLETWGH
ncbi:hypothetical protein RHGRI_010264 [Rhododendron griersonianum]|uniref:S-adenosyl-L-methionine-dependent methyltransferase n=1 Tax=Rhododendron griersonianum TaxID=479676 RepID=A0AAV6KHV4_9ERIC|nr:hypothetical protein RHGRI_010264 [Rhododendron griersonianum]